MSYRISALPLEPFAHLFGKSDAELLAQGARRMVADEKPGYPCRVTLMDAEPGEFLILTNYQHLPESGSPFRATGPVFVRETARETAEPINDKVPDYLAGRLLSLRAYDREGIMLDADVVTGNELEPMIARMFEDGDVAYLHAHFAKRGCYACRIDRN
jgi:hypothetical protein